MNQFPFSSKQKALFVCFKCRVGGKRVLPFYWEESGKPGRWPCPKCKKPLVFLGRYFKIPSQSALDQWRKAELLWRSGWIADGFSGGPPTLRDAREFVQVPEAIPRHSMKRRAENEERWRKLRAKREQFQRHKTA
jgi:hypothetical protein